MSQIIFSINRRAAYADVSRTSVLDDIPIQARIQRGPRIVINGVYSVPGSVNLLVKQAARKAQIKPPLLHLLNFPAAFDRKGIVGPLVAERSHVSSIQI